MYTLLAEIMESVFHHPKRVISIGRPQKKSSLQPEPSPLNSTCATASVNSSFLSVHHFIINNHIFAAIWDQSWIHIDTNTTAKCLQHHWQRELLFAS